MFCLYIIEQIIQLLAELRKLEDLHNLIPRCFILVRIIYTSVTNMVLNLFVKSAHVCTYRNISVSERSVAIFGQII